jgi:hypothetical protein
MLIFKATDENNIQLRKYVHNLLNQFVSMLAPNTNIINNLIEFTFLYPYLLIIILMFLLILNNKNIFVGGFVIFLFCLLLLTIAVFITLNIYFNFYVNVGVVAMIFTIFLLSLEKANVLPRVIYSHLPYGFKKRIFKPIYNIINTYIFNKFREIFYNLLQILNMYLVFIKISPQYQLNTAQYIANISNYFKHISITECNKKLTYKDHVFQIGRHLLFIIGFNKLQQVYAKKPKKAIGIAVGLILSISLTLYGIIYLVYNDSESYVDGGSIYSNSYHY